MNKVILLFLKIIWLIYVNINKNNKIINYFNFTISLRNIIYYSFILFNIYHEGC